MTRYDRLRSNAAVLGELGARLQQHRVRQNITQQELARQSGVSTSTVQRLEAGGSIQLGAFLSVLRQLGMLHNLEALVPAPSGPSPLEQLAKQPQRKRAARKK